MIDDKDTPITLETDANGAYWEFVLTIDDYKVTIAKIHLALVEKDKPRDICLSLIKTLLEQRMSEAHEGIFKETDNADKTQH